VLVGSGPGGVADGLVLFAGIFAVPGAVQEHGGDERGGFLDAGLLLTRHRNNLKAGMTPQDAAASALNSAGRAVLFAGTTVCIALLGMLVLRVGYVSGLGIAAAITVLFTVAAAVTLLPALLGFLGMRVLVPPGTPAAGR